MAERAPRVGIPRALHYYPYYPMMRTFFEALGVEVVVSPRTNRSILDMGVSLATTETCLPTKVFLGHVASLREAKCDYIFVPVVHSLGQDSYNCSKLLGLPDIVRSCVPDCPPIRSVFIDFNRGKRFLYESIYRLVQPFTWNPLTVKKAGEAALQTHQKFQDLMNRNSLTIPEAIEQLFPENDNIRKGKIVPPDLTMAVIGHPYIIYDEYVSNNLLFHLRNLGVRVLTPEMATAKQLEEGIRKAAYCPSWTCEDELTGAAEHYLNVEEVSGVISVVPYGCGPDSIMEEVVEARAKQPEYSKKRHMMVTVDEHDAYAGLLSRLEAFTDMFRRGRRLK